ncbi:ABC transporter substrate-binding protein [Pseudoroseicyclus tamaricis]|uniref:ABC transporter substrate-binding protein n=2 Tax=Pseudoroseicyclus tamaricis TaxID=2705421 RepID=A0A6B2JR81_9RHOB|nr:ABC transporter substrate-binding protein [Pseudoroseicyclus tamaricis]NDV00560.1 ABC transporter substrate-binding protein [Pseudoroseicyclus tamaricis]
MTKLNGIHGRTPFRGRMASGACAAALALGMAGSAATADTLRIAGQGDIGTLDPQAQNSQITISVLSMVYESLVTRDEDLQMVPSLALSWEPVADTTWRFELRPDVTFHDGSAFDAEDVKFTIERAQAETSQFANFVGSIASVEVIDDLTVEIETAMVDPLLPDKLGYIMIMDSGWAEANGVTVPQDLGNEENTYAVMNANGTGPYTIAERVPDNRTVLEINPDYWGEMADDIEEVIYLPISSPPTRISSLISGEVDVVIDVPPQDVQRLESTDGLTVARSPELRTIFFGFDHASGELRHGDAGGTNPFQDLRVRQAVDSAIDADTISRVVMRGLSQPTAQLIAPGNFGWNPEGDERAPFDIEHARELLAEAGYPDGFSVRMDCPTDTYTNPEQICQAVSAMMSQIGIDIDLNLIPRAQFIPLLWDKDTSFFIIGFNTAYFDAMYVLETLLMTQTGEDGEGIYNYSGYSNPEFDELVREARVELDRDRRQELMYEAFAIARADVAYAPLHTQTLVYAMRDGVDVPVRPDNFIEIRWVTMD